MTRVGGTHHVLGIKALLSELGDRQGTVLLRSARRQRGKADHEEVEAGERDHVDGELAQVAVELAGEPEAARRTANRRGNQMVQISVRGGSQLESAEADVVQRLVVQGEALVGILHELVDGKGGVVGLHDGVGNLGRGDDGVGRHDAVGVLLADLGDEEGAHTGAGAAAHGVSELEALHAVAGLGLLANDVEDGVDELGTLGVVALGPVVAGAGLTEDEVVGTEELAERPGADAVHGTGLEVHEDGTGDVASASGLVEVDVDPLQLKVRVAVVRAGGVNSVLVGHDCGVG